VRVPGSLSPQTANGRRSGLTELALSGRGRSWSRLSQRTSPPKAIYKPYTLECRATPRLPQGHLQAIYSGVQSHPKATSRPPQGYPKATPRLPQGHPKATPRLPQGYTKARGAASWSRFRAAPGRILIPPPRLAALEFGHFQPNSETECRVEWRAAICFRRPRGLWPRGVTEKDFPGPPYLGGSIATMRHMADSISMPRSG
jgi:hypothetical protein